jgi:hypothetical protein
VTVTGERSEATAGKALEALANLHGERSERLNSMEVADWAARLRVMTKSTSLVLAKHDLCFADIEHGSIAAPVTERTAYWGNSGPR